MTRVKKGQNALKTRRNILRQVKGFRLGRSKKEIQAYEALAHAGKYAFAHRKDKKADNRGIWNTQISAFLTANGAPSYSKFIGAATKKKMLVNRKMLALLANEHPETMKKIIAHVGTLATPAAKPVKVAKKAAVAA